MEQNMKNVLNMKFVGFFFGVVFVIVAVFFFFGNARAAEVGYEASPVNDGVYIEEPVEVGSHGLNVHQNADTVVGAVLAKQLWVRPVLKHDGKDLNADAVESLAWTQWLPVVEKGGTLDRVDVSDHLVARKVTWHENVAWDDVIV